MRTQLPKQESLFERMQEQIINQEDMHVINPTKEALDEIRLEGQAVNVEEGERLVAKYYIKRLGTNDEMKDFGLCDHINDLQSIGDGVYFYFFLMKFLGILFAVIAGIALIPFVVNIIGGGMSFQSQIDLLSATTLGNIERIGLNSTELLLLNSTVSIQSNPELAAKLSTLRTLYFMQMSSDMAICLALFIGYYVLRHLINRKIKESQARNISVKQYTLYVQGLPESNITEEEVKAYFEKFSKVVRCNLAYKYFGCLPDLMEIARHQFRLKNLAGKKSKRVDKERQELQIAVHKNRIRVAEAMQLNNFDMNDRSSFKVIAAFVTFDDPKAPRDIVGQFRTEYRRNFFQKLFCMAAKVRSRFLFQGRKLAFLKPDHPTNIYWENLEKTAWSKVLKSVMAFGIFVLVMLLSLAINIFLTALANQDQPAISCGTTVYTAADIDLQGDSPLKYEVIYCFCSSKGLTQILNDSTIFSYCNKYYLEQVKEIGVSISVGIAVSLINMLCEFIAFQLIGFIGLVSVSEVVTQKIFLAFVLQYINTAFVVFVIYQQFYGWSLIQFINLIFRTEVIKIQRLYPDINRGWYGKVGSKIILPIIIAIFSPHLLKFLITVIQSRYRRFKARSAKNQKKYMQLRMPTTFLLEARYAKVLTAFFVTMTFATGIPLLLFCFLCMILVMYWADKILCLRFAGKPPLYSEGLIETIVKAIPAALIIHMVFGIYIFGNEDIFPSSVAFNEFYREFDALINTSQFFEEIFRKCYKCLPYTLEMLLFLVIFLFEDLIEFIITRVRARTQNRVFADNVELGTYTTNYKRIAYFSLPNYNIALNPKYRELLKMMLVQFNTVRELAKAKTGLKAGADKQLNETVNQPIASIMPEFAEAEAEAEELSLHNRNLNAGIEEEPGN